jgi:hypothetical protein
VRTERSSLRSVTRCAGEVHGAGGTVTLFEKCCGTVGFGAVAAEHR